MRNHVLSSPLMTGTALQESFLHSRRWNIGFTWNGWRYYFIFPFYFLSIHVLLKSRFTLKFTFTSQILILVNEYLLYVIMTPGFKKSLPALRGVPNAFCTSGEYKSFNDSSYKIKHYKIKETNTTIQKDLLT